VCVAVCAGARAASKSRRAERQKRAAAMRRVRGAVFRFMPRVRRQQAQARLYGFTSVMRAESFLHARRGPRSER